MFLSLITNFKNMIKRQNSSLDTNTFVSCDMRVDKKNSKLYVGNTLGGKPDGKGKMYIGTNQLFIGEFKNSEPTENGKMYVLKCQGIWKDDSYAG